MNGFTSPEMNADTNQKGFFGKHARVRAQRLRGELSEGYIHPVSSVNAFLKTEKIKFQIGEDEVGVEFDSIEDCTLCVKYVNPNVKVPGAPGTKKKTAKRASKIIDEQFRLHSDTSQLKANMHRIDPDSLISISYKLHGTSATSANVLCKKPLKWYEKVLKFTGVNIVDTRYDYVIASRKVIKNKYADQKSNSFYDFDLWTHTFNELKDTIQDGITMYGEIVGFLPSGRHIQKGFDYGLCQGESKFYVYRITYTNAKGDVFEFSRPQIDRYCERYFLNVVPLFYYGKAKDLYPELEVSDHWRENFIAKLIEAYTEKDCYMCINKVPEEGVVIVKEDDAWQGFKLKSARFYEYESVELDSGEANIEDQEEDREFDY